MLIPKTEKLYLKSFALTSNPNKICIIPEQGKL